MTLEEQKDVTMKFQKNAYMFPSPVDINELQYINKYNLSIH